MNQRRLPKLIQLTKQLLVLFLLTKLSNGTLTINKLDNQAGFQVIRQSEIPLIQNFSKILHIIDISELEIILSNIESNIDSTFSKSEDLLLIKQLENQIQKTKHNIKTLSLHRNKRGLINLGGNVFNWLFGTMDHDDKLEIEEHLKTIDFNNNNLINNFNKQIKINNDLQSNIKTLKNRIDENQILTLKSMNYTTDVTKRSIKNLHFLSILSDINILNSEIDKIQQNIVFAKHGIMSHSVLTDKEINEFNIDVFKYKEIKSSLLEYDSKLIFAILIPNLTENLAIKYKIIPVPNDNNEEIYIENINIIEFKNKIYIDNGEINVKKLKLADNCTNNLMNESYEQCHKIIKKNIEIMEIDSNMILVKNSKNDTLLSNCDYAKYKLNKNVLIKFNNCTLKINDVMFSNIEKTVTNHIILPNYLSINKVNLKMNIEDIHLKQIENIREITELKSTHKVNTIMTYSFITIIMIIILMILIAYFIRIKLFKNITLCKGKIDTNQKKRKTESQESFQSNNGGIIYPKVPDYKS